MQDKSHSLFEFCMQSHLSGLCIFGAARDYISRGWYQSVWWRMLCPDKANSSSSSHPTSPKSTAIIFLKNTKNVKDSYRFGQPIRLYRLSYDYIAEVEADAEKATSLYNIFLFILLQASLITHAKTSQVKKASLLMKRLSTFPKSITQPESMSTFPGESVFP